MVSLIYFHNCRVETPHKAVVYILEKEYITFVPNHFYVDNL